MAMSGKFDPKMLSALDLAFVGDGVYGLLVREMLARDGSRRWVSCTAWRWPM